MSRYGKMKKHIYKWRNINREKYREYIKNYLKNKDYRRYYAYYNVNGELKRIIATGKLVEFKEKLIKIYNKYEATPDRIRIIRGIRKREWINNNRKIEEVIRKIEEKEKELEELRKNEENKE